MDEELTTQERERIELQEFLKQMVDLINEKFEKQSSSVQEVKNEINMVIERELGGLKTNIDSIRSSLDSLSEKIENRKIMIEKEILEKLK